MELSVTQVEATSILPLRELFRHEAGCQIIHDSFARRGFSHAYHIHAGDRLAGYGLVAHRHYPDTLHEFFLLPEFQFYTAAAFHTLLRTSGAARIRSQSNLPVLTALLYQCCEGVTPEEFLFAAGGFPDLKNRGGELVLVTQEVRDALQEPRPDPGEWCVRRGDLAVAVGGVLHHYNPPFGDVYVRVHEAFRRRGYGSFLVQELRRIAYESGHIPAARCNPDNLASQKTLVRAGFRVCGRMLEGAVSAARLRNSGG